MKDAVKNGSGKAMKRAKPNVAETWQPLRIGWESAKANLVPTVALWLLACSLVFAYLFVPAFAEVLEPVWRWQVESGRLAPFLNRVFFCGLLPGAFLCLCPSLRPRHLLSVIAVESVWSGLMGIAGDWALRLLALLFGSGRDLGTLLAKTFVDQFVWTVLFIAPANAVFHFWLVRDFSFVRTRREWPSRFYGELVAPNLLSNWCVWMPVQFTVFMFPLDLQIHVNGLVCAFWTLMCLQIGKRTR